MEDFAAFDDFPAVPDVPDETAPNTQYYVDEEEVHQKTHIAQFR